MKNRYEVRGETTAVFLSRKDGSVLETLIDTADLSKAMEWPGTWYPAWCENTKSFYCKTAARKPDGNRTMLRLHRYLLDAPAHLFVDHKNHDTLDNRRCNIRLATDAENKQNKCGPGKLNKTSGVRGVYWSKRDRVWRAQVSICGKTKCLGSFDTLEVAAEVVQLWRATNLPFSAMDHPD